MVIRGATFFLNLNKIVIRTGSIRCQIVTFIIFIEFIWLDFDYTNGIKEQSTSVHDEMICFSYLKAL